MKLEYRYIPASAEGLLKGYLTQTSFPPPPSPFIHVPIASMIRRLVSIPNSECSDSIDWYTCDMTS